MKHGAPLSRHCEQQRCEILALLLLTRDSSPKIALDISHLLCKVRHTLEGIMRQYTTQQAADKIGVTQVAIQVAIHRGRLLAFKIGRDWIIDQEELNRWNKVRRKKRAV